MFDGSAFLEVDAAQVNEKPFLIEHQTFATTVPGKTYLFKISAFNVNGDPISSSVRFVLGDLPGKPTNAPISDSDYSSAPRLKIDFEVVTDDGGAAILSYGLELDYGKGGPFEILMGSLSDSLSTTCSTSNVERGHVYRVRFRARNGVGWGSYSNIAYIKAS